jgi:ABC-type antimicrobial peptide transport system permease subunit
MIRTRGEPQTFVSTVQEQIRALDPNLPAGAIKTMEQRMEMPLWPLRTAAGFFTICGTLALVLATVGLFGTTFLAVNQRTREFGIRTALGATRGRVMKLVIREGFWLALPGIALGLGGAIVAGRLLAHTIFRLSSGDPTTYAATAAVQAIVAVIACLLPAYKATKADPITALRVD